jgi:hypothetical protein
VVEPVQRVAVDVIEPVQRVLVDVVEPVQRYGQFAEASWIEAAEAVLGPVVENAL